MFYPEPVSSGSDWQPFVGPELQRLIASKDLEESAAEEIESSAIRILSRCNSPEWDHKAVTATLAVGAVQSGKTLSFTAVAAAARDNAYPMIVVLAGVTNNLREQTFGRLKQDLEISGQRGVQAWSAIDSPSRDDIPATLQKLRRWNVAHARTRPTTIAVVLKNPTRIEAAAEYISGLTKELGRGFPVLIIDDEADQAGLNTLFKKEKESATYGAIKNLRAAADNHTYLMYTATPQANLLVSIADAMSPQTVTVLKSGRDYVGGAQIFGDSGSRFLKEIDDLDTALEPSSIEPPESLTAALAFYFLALSVAWQRQKPFPLTMLVHPSSGKSLHSTYERWITSIRSMIQVAIDDDPDYVIEFSEKYFGAAYADLASEDSSDLPELSELVEILGDILHLVRVCVVNSDDGFEIGEDDWDESPGWIVIGGDKLNRGFTVRNLAVTYMPRGPGVKNVDTVQQRGRFFGYKRSYLELLRGWMSAPTASMYREYVSHEAAMREELSHLDVEGKSLQNWRRSFMLKPGLKLTRANVISLRVDAQALRTGWVFTQTHLYGQGVVLGTALSQQVSELLHNSTPDERDLRKDADRRNRMCTSSLGELLPLLVDWEAAPEERARLDVLLLLLRSAPGHEDEIVELYDMDATIRRNGVGARGRGLSRLDRVRLEEQLARPDFEVSQLAGSSISALQQGRSGSTSAQYIGDASFRAVDSISIQVHHVSPGIESNGESPAVMALAVWIPERLSRSVILQREDDDHAAH